jgi:hypothetical protein
MTSTSFGLMVIIAVGLAVLGGTTFPRRTSTP